MTLNFIYENIQNIILPSIKGLTPSIHDSEKMSQELLTPPMMPPQESVFFLFSYYFYYINYKNNYFNYLK